jgi:uncharacterized membrane protein
MVGVRDFINVFITKRSALRFYTFLIVWSQVIGARSWQLSLAFTVHHIAVRALDFGGIWTNAGQSQLRAPGAAPLGDSRRLLRYTEERLV